MSSILSSLAFIKANVDSGISVWDSLVRLMLNVIKNNGIREVSAEVFSKAFTDNYGISIPIHPMNTIIGKIKQNGFIDDDYGKWLINKKRIDDFVIDTRNSENYEIVLRDLSSFIKERFGISKTIDEVERLFIGYINNYDSDILFSLETRSMLPQIEITGAEKYVISAYIESLVEKESVIIGIIENIVLANIHLNSIFIVEKNRKLKLNRAYVYLDTRILLRITGIEGSFRKEEYINLLQILFDNRCNLRVFDVHYNEVNDILDDCVKWLESGKKSTPKYASRALRYYVEHNCSVSDVLMSKAELDDLLKKYRIGIDVHNYDYDELNQYNIDEKVLYNKIIELYGRNGNHFESQNIDEMVWNDVKAISSVYRKRKGFRANGIENISAILVTSNRTLSKAVREYNRDRGFDEKYSECITDTYWGTAIWLNTAYKETSFYRKKLIADSIALTQMNPRLKEKYLKNLDEMKEKGDLTETEYYVLREYSRASMFVKDATFNDEDEYSDNLPEEILEKFADEIRKPLEVVIADKGACIDSKESELCAHQERYDKQKEFIERKSKSTSIVVMVLFGIMVNIPSMVLVFIDYISDPNIRLIIRIVSFVIGLIIGIDGFGRKAIGKLIYQKRKKHLLKQWDLV